MAAGLRGGFLDSVRRHRHEARPFDHWVLERALPARTCDEVLALPFAPPAAASFDGRRESNNSTRVYFTPALQAQYPVCAAVAEVFQDQGTRDALATLTGASLDGGRLRIEYCQDVDGFWLEPHLDIPVKLLTMLIYLSDDPALADAGTDVYGPGPEHPPMGRVDYSQGRGLIFTPGSDTWHGFTPRPIHGVRKTLIVNYVGPEWRAVEELA
ncbi:2OG-Fe(II) oxygenase [Phenylobacterium montanum]|uniref:2OG-Fe(II) oxygenase n=1 Tax=Phenylobacterium montanum TaxID=2823693 RepID=A0A975IUA2_9CAUL|nr:2OG-Fe(II) oxygenase [Caulobacter sp. S6]QUD87540.1 2OG-Fe(II) oxygenase [Caulobacter sp. S6]